MRLAPMFLALGLVMAGASPAGASECGADFTETCKGYCGGLGSDDWCECDAGCGSYCCPDYQTCCEGCVIDCAGKECGGDGCGDTCGSCPLGVVWSCSVQGQCVCTPICDGAVCGKDGCGGTCGECAAGLVCAGGKCVNQPCTPACTAKECGADGCGDTCPPGCSPGANCNVWGQCIGCSPQCTGKQCGDDGCGGVCGQCAAGLSCSADGLCVNPPTDVAEGAVIPDSVITDTESPPDDAGPDDVPVPLDQGPLPDNTPGYDPGQPAKPDTTITADITINCPNGYIVSYGQCVPNPNQPSDTGGGCAASHPVGVIPFWLLGLLPLALRRLTSTRL